MEDLISRTPHVAEQIFQQLDYASLKNCKKAAKSWKNSIQNKNLIFLQNINVPKVLKNGNTSLHIAAKMGNTEIFKKCFDIEDDKNPKNNDRSTPFHLTCLYGHVEIAKLILKKSLQFDINLNEKDTYGLTPYQYALLKCSSSVKDAIEKKSVNFKKGPN